MKKIYLLACLLAPILSPVTWAGEAEDKGLAIAKEADHRNQGYGDNVTELTMTLIDADQSTSTREMDIKTLEVTAPGEGDKSLLTFSKPLDVQGTTLLTHAHVSEPDDQWLYLPALKRAKRISSSNKTGAFMGSEFAYEDLIPQEVEEYHDRFLRDESCGPLQCFVVENRPNYSDSGYSRLVAWLDQAEYRLQKVEFYDPSDRLLKTLTADGYKLYSDKYWRPQVLLMVNHQNGKSTRLNFHDYRFKTGLNEQDFAQSSLQRVR